MKIIISLKTINNRRNKIQINNYLKFHIKNSLKTILHQIYHLKQNMKMFNINN